ELMARAGAVDFGDQIVHVLRLLRSRSYVLGAYQRRFRYILVDEFQDTNHAQFELVKLLAARHGNVAVVADDDQSIYRWRGAAISNVLGFLERYPEARQIVLTENYRSHQAILDAAYRLIVHNNPDRLEVRSAISKHLTAAREAAGPPPVHLHYETATQEADAVASMIRERVDAGTWTHDDVAVLVRSNNDADPFLRSLNVKGLPWTFSGNSGLYGRPEIRLLIAFLRSVVHTDESVSLHYLASSDLYDVPIVDLTRCSSYADRRHLHLFDVLRRTSEIPEVRDHVGEAGHATIRQLVADLERYMELSREVPTGEVLYQFIKDSGWLTRLYREETARDVAEGRNITRFFDRVKSASRALRYDNVREFVKHLDALIEAGEDPAVAEADIETPAVRVLTVHKAKGLEFPVVFLVNLVHEKFPSRRRRDALELPLPLTKDVLPTGDHHQQEERRLFYVGMTRARRELYLTSASDYGGTRRRRVSQFVLEALDLPPDATRPFKARAVEQIEHFAPTAESEDAALVPLPADAELIVSHKQIDDYQTCPLKYRNIHVRRMPIRRHHAVAYGAVVHTVVEYYLRRRAVGNYTPRDDLLAVFDRAWVGEDILHDRPGRHEPAEGFLTREHEEARKLAGREALKRFWHQEEAEGIKPTWIEKEFGFALGLDRVRGRYDRVDEDLLGSVIIDYKTSDVRRQKEADRRVAESLQLRMYALAWREMTGRLPQRVELRFIDSSVVGRHTPTNDDCEEAVAAVTAAAAGIRARRFDATPSFGACRSCAYNQICPYTATSE
ncbi:MAG: ATP-dependent helicase, partial [Candidatus Rokuibacteriota bacterium]